MALTRKMLKAMGIEDEKIDQIIDAHTETVEGLKAEREEYKANAEKLTEVQAELNSLKAKGDDGLKEKYDKLKTDFDNYKAEVENAKKLEAKKDAYRELIKDAGLSDKGAEKALKYADWDHIEVEDGKIKDSKDHMKALKEEWAEYVVRENTEGASVTNPPANNGSSKYTSKADIMKIKDTSERQKAIKENMELFQK